MAGYDGARGTTFARLLSLRASSRRSAQELSALAETLHANRFFRSLPPAVLHHICPGVDYRRLEPGAPLISGCRYTDPFLRKHFCVVLSGSLAVSVLEPRALASCRPHSVRPPAAHCLPFHAPYPRPAPAHLCVRGCCR